MSLFLDENKKDKLNFYHTTHPSILRCSLYILFSILLKLLKRLCEYDKNAIGFSERAIEYNRNRNISAKS